MSFLAGLLAGAALVVAAIFVLAARVMFGRNDK